MENTNPVVNEEVTASDSEVVKPQEQEKEVKEEASSTPAPQAGSKTDPNLLLKSLKEERQRVKELEEELALKSSAPSEDEFASDEGKALKSEINTLKSELSEIKGELTKKDILISYPVLKDKWDELEEFRADPENKGMNLRTSAKAFLVEKGLMDASRKGLEKPTGGPRVPLDAGISAQEAENLMKTDFKRYKELVKKGQIKIQ